MSFLNDGIPQKWLTWKRPRRDFLVWNYLVRIQLKWILLNGSPQKRSFRDVNTYKLGLFLYRKKHKCVVKGRKEGNIYWALLFFFYHNSNLGKETQDFMCLFVSLSSLYPPFFLPLPPPANSNKNQSNICDDLTDFCVSGSSLVK